MSFTHPFPCTSHLLSPATRVRACADLAVAVVITASLLHRFRGVVDPMDAAVIADPLHPDIFADCRIFDTHTCTCCVCSFCS